ncbi:MAG TPA: hypothetical protein VFH66_16230 [Mycobacteriales bacterium]|nr:hypothetical protein [Mycobacteriales bacterium]
MTSWNAPLSPRRRLRSALQLLRHLAFIALVSATGYVLALLSLELADRGGWLSVLGWMAFTAVILVGAAFVRRSCCLRRAHGTV